MSCFIFLSFTQADDDHTHGLITRWLVKALRRRLRAALGIEGADILCAPDVEAGDGRYRVIANRLALGAFHVSLVTPTLLRSPTWRKDLRWFSEERDRSLPFKAVIGIPFLPTAELNERARAEDSSRDQIGRNPASVLLQFRLIPFDVDVLDLGVSDWDGSEGLQSLARDIVDRVAGAQRSLPPYLSTTTLIDTEPIKQRPLAPVLPVIPERKDTEEPSTHQLRIEEFVKEKAFLGEHFTDFLHKRLTHLRSHQGGVPVLLLIDAGTTLFPVIRELGKIATRGPSLDHVCMVTNNLPAVRWLLRNGRPAENKWKEIALKTVLLPGVPLPAYSASTGWEQGDGFDGFEGIIGHLQTHHIVEQIGVLKHAGWKGRIIAVVTGNWVRVRRTFPSIAVPMARGRGHLMLKQALCDVADEVYVLAPLGKVVTGDPSEVHATLREVSPPHDAHQEYDEVRTGNDIVAPQDDLGRTDEEREDLAGKMQLVTTYRLPNRLLSGMSELLQRPGYMLARQVHEANYAEMKHAFAERSYRSHWMFLFDDLDRDLMDEFRQEFPHRESWTKRFFDLMNVDPAVEQEINTALRHQTYPARAVDRHDL